MIREKLVELTGDEELLFVDGMDGAIIGVDLVDNRVVYSYSLLLEQLMLQDMTEEEAIEYADYNIITAYVGERTPIYVFESHID